MAFWLNPLDFYHKSSSEAWVRALWGFLSPPTQGCGSLLTREKWTLDEEKDGQRQQHIFLAPQTHCLETIKKKVSFLRA